MCAEETYEADPNNHYAAADNNEDNVVDDDGDCKPDAGMMMTLY